MPAAYENPTQPFGYEGGQKQFQLDDQTFLKGSMDIRLKGADAGLKESQLRQKQRYEELQWQRGMRPQGGSPQPPAAMIEGLLREAEEDTLDRLRSGDFKEGTLGVQRVTAARSHLDSAAAARARAEHSGFQVERDNAVAMGELATGIEALPPAEQPRALQEALLRHQVGGGKVDPMLLNNPITDYNVGEVLGYLKESSFTAKERAELNEKQRRTTAYESGINSANKRRALISSADFIRERAQAQQEGRLKAVGESSDPPPKEVSVADTYIRARFPDLPPAESRDVARLVATRKKELMKAIPGLTSEEALGRAFLEQKRAGAFRAATQGSTAASAIPAPTKEAEYVKGKYYVGMTGDIRQYLGGGKLGPVVSANARAQKVEPPQEEPDDEDTSVGGEGNFPEDEEE